ncbi:ornithine carbamoyltransferase, partial [Bacillus cereus]
KHSNSYSRIFLKQEWYSSGGHGMFFKVEKEMQMGRGETVSDTAKVLSQYIDGIMIRTFSHADVEELAKESSIP